MRLSECLINLERRRDDNCSLPSRVESNKSATSSVRSRRAKAAVKAASIQVELEFLDKEIEFKRLQMLKELTKAKAEEAIMRRLEREDQDSPLKSTNVEEQEENGMEAKFKLNLRETLSQTNIKSETTPQSNIKSETPPQSNIKSETSPSTNIKSETPPLSNIKSETPLQCDVKSETPPQCDVKSETPNYNVRFDDPSRQGRVPLNPYADRYTPRSPLNDTLYSTMQTSTYLSPTREQEFREERLCSVLKLIVEQQQTSCLPKQQPPVFSGGYYDFPRFASAFDSLIEGRITDPRQRLYYLDRYTSGEANEIIKGLVTLNTP